ncbi:MAG: hypothetical protein HFE63_06670 [Clostridiales bacterium]|nr:hypothetical protein [Clostridiales bacterium]
MKNSKHYIISVLIAAIVLTSVSMVAYQSKPNNDDSQTESGGLTAEDTVTDEPEVIYDLDGYQLNVAKIAQDSIPWVLVSLCADEENGDVLNDAIVKRNRTVTEKYNFTLTETEFQSSALPTIRNLVNSGDDEYQLIFDGVNMLGSDLTSGIFLDLSDVEGLELDKACWNQNLISSLSIGDHVYLIGGDITASDEDSVEVLVYNTSYAKNLQIGDLYQLVRDGKWTVDRMLEACKLAVFDLNGDTNMDLEDSYGVLANEDGISAMLVSCGVSAISKDSDGVPILTANSDRYTEAFDSLSRIYNNSVWHSYEGVTTDLQVSRLETNKNLFVNAVTSFARRFLRDVKTDFGFLPTPKLDESQENYYSCIVNSTCVLAVPSTVGDPETVGLALQLMAEGSEDITRAYYDVCLQSKYTRDEESYEMLKISIKNIVYDIGYMYSSQFAGLHNKLIDAMKNGNNNIASIIASNSSAVEAAISKYIGDQ